MFCKILKNYILREIYMTYWHMQLRPKGDDIEFREEDFLNKEKIIVIDGDEGNSQIRQFRDDMNENDIVLIKRGRKPIALVRIIENVEKINHKNKWYNYQRKIEILAFTNDKQKEKIVPAVRLSKSVNKNSELYEFIDSWYNSIINLKYTDIDLNNNEYKINSVYIKELNMFKDFEINFTDNKDKPLPIIVIAGKNGTGKTTLLKYLSDYNLNDGDFIEIFKTRNADEIELFFDDKEIIVDKFKLTKSMYGVTEKKSEYREHIEYLAVQVGNIENIESKLADYYLNQAQKLDSFKKSLKEIQNYISNIFKSLELTFNISNIDYQDKKIYFKNSNNEEFSINDLSTGEKTLVSKILFLYLNNINNKIILIDEPELSLHPSWQNKVLELYETFAIENNCQIILATHSPHIIASSKNEYIRLLTKNKETKKIEIIDNLYAHGRDINSVLFDVMGEVLYRPDEYKNKIDNLYYVIEEEKDYEKSIELLEELKKDYGQKDRVIIEISMYIDMMFESKQI